MPVNGKELRRQRDVETLKRSALRLRARVKELMVLIKKKGPAEHLKQELIAKHARLTRTTKLLHRRGVNTVAFFEEHDRKLLPPKKPPVVVIAPNQLRASPSGSGAYTLGNSLRIWR